MNTMLVTVEDDGIGFDPRPTESAMTQLGLGLIGIRERVSTLGGTLRLESAPGRGTRLTVELPARVEGISMDNRERQQDSVVVKPALHEVLGG
jgi:glucose-6-phosphate-specific signal transduction histidine kinase